MLEKRYDNELEQDVSDMIWLIFGSAVHNILEQADEYNMTETRFEHEITNGYYLTGQIDLYNKDTFAVEDYKTASVWKIVNKDFDDWYKQGMMYAWLLLNNGYIVTKVRVHAMLKDWQISKARYDDNYPKQAVYTYEFDVNTRMLMEIEDYIRARFKEIIAHEKSSDDMLPLCTAEERWQATNKYAVMKNSRQTAIKIYDTMEEAKTDPRGDYIQERIGEPRRCLDYCAVCNKCDFYKKLLKEEI